MSEPPRDQQPRVPRLPEPGWLPDPATIGVERYWDGFQWTPYTRMKGASHAWPPAGGASPSGGRRRGRGGRRGAGGGRRVGGGVWLFAAVAVAAIATMGYRGALPEWTNWPDSWVMSTPTGPAVEYPVFGSDELVLYLARSMVAQEDSINVTFTGAGSSDGLDKIQDAMREALAQNPYVFVREWEVQVRPASTTITPTYVYSDIEAEQRRIETRAALTELVASSGALTATTQSDQVRLLHDAIAAHARYDWDAYDTINNGGHDARVEASQEAFGILVNGTAVCTGYAETMLLAAHALSIEAVVITGNVNQGLTTGGHAWNRVFVDGEWRVVDVTWDDVPVGRTGHEVLRHDYLLLVPGDPLLQTREQDMEWVVDGNEGLYS